MRVILIQLYYINIHEHENIMLIAQKLAKIKKNYRKRKIGKFML